MLAPGGPRKTQKDAVRRGTGPAARKAQKFGGREVTLSQAMSAGKWELLAWLEARAKATASD